MSDETTQAQGQKPAISAESNAAIHASDNETVKRIQELLAAGIDPKDLMEQLKKEVHGRFESGANQIASAANANDPALLAMVSDLERAFYDVANHPAEESFRQALAQSIANIRARAEQELQQTTQQTQQGDAIAQALSQGASPDASVTPKQPVGEHTEEELRRQQAAAGKSHGLAS